MEKKIVYVEPADYFPKDIRKKYKLGEFAEPNAETETKDAVDTEGEDGGDDAESRLTPKE